MSKEIKALPGDVISIFVFTVSEWMWRNQRSWAVPSRSQFRPLQVAPLCMALLTSSHMNASRVGVCSGFCVSLAPCLFCYLCALRGSSITLITRTSPNWMRFQLSGWPFQLWPSVTSMSSASAEWQRMTFTMRGSYWACSTTGESNSIRHVKLFAYVFTFILVSIHIYLLSSTAEAIWPMQY